MFPSVVLRHVQDVQKVLRLQLRRLVPGDVPLGEVGDLWEAYDAVERQAAAAELLLAERVEQSRAWARAGERSAGDHLARRAGTSRGAARRGLAASRKLGGLPATEAALRRGELSQAQAETIADAAGVNAGAERSLLETARSGNLVRLREQANRAKAAGDPDPDATHRRLHRERRLRRFTDGEGAWNLQARGTADAGAALNAALDPVIDEVFREARQTGREEPREAYAFDALLRLARRGRDGDAVTSMSWAPPSTPGAASDRAATARPAGAHSPGTAAPTPAPDPGPERDPEPDPGRERGPEPDPGSERGPEPGPRPERGPEPGPRPERDPEPDPGRERGPEPDARSERGPDVDAGRLRRPCTGRPPDGRTAGGSPDASDGATPTDAGAGRGSPDADAGRGSPGAVARPRVLPATDHRDEAGVDQHSPARRSGPTTNPSFLALLRVDLDALTRGRVESDETCDIAGVGAVPATVARRLLGDAVLKLVITRGTDVVNVTNLGRGPTAAQRIALLWNTPGCTNTACSNTLAIDHDHRTPWTEVRHTALANLDRLCRPCHDRKTHHRWALVAGNGPRPLVPPDDPRHPDHAPQPTSARQVRDPRRPDHPRDPDDPRRHAHARQTGDAGQAHEPRHPDDAPRPAPNAGPPGPPRSERDAPGQHAGSLFGADVA